MILFIFTTSYILKKLTHTNNMNFNNRYTAKAKATFQGTTIIEAENLGDEEIEKRVRSLKTLTKPNS